MTTQTLKFYSDAGHGWLAVKVSVLAELGLLSKITSYSFIKGKTAYLEEDCDCTFFAEAMKVRGLSWNPVQSRRNTDVGRSPIRSYDRYTMSKAVQALSNKKGV